MDNQPVIDALAALLAGLQQNVQVLQHKDEQAALISQHEEYQAKLLEKHDALLLQLRSLSSQVSELTSIVRELVSKPKTAWNSHAHGPVQAAQPGSFTFRPPMSTPFRTATDYSHQCGSIRGQNQPPSRSNRKFVQHPKVLLCKILCYACHKYGHFQWNCSRSVSVSGCIQAEPSKPSGRSRPSNQLKFSPISEFNNCPVSVFSTEAQSWLPMITASIARVGSLSTAVSSASEYSVIGATFVRNLTVRRPKAINYLVNVDGTQLHVLGYVDLSVRFKESVVELKRVKVVKESIYPLILILPLQERLCHLPYIFFLIFSFLNVFQNILPYLPLLLIFYL